MHRKIWAVFYQGDTKDILSGTQLYRLVADQESWTEFLSMVLGGPPARMKVVLDNGRLETVKCLLQDRTTANSTFANPLG